MIQTNLLINILFILAGFLGLIVSLIILKNHKSNLIMNIYFVLFLFTFSLKHFFLGFFLIYHIEKIVDYLPLYSYTSSLSLPFLYLYLKKVHTTNNYFEWKEFKTHFIIPSAILLLTLYVYSFIFNPLKNQNSSIQYLASFLFSLIYVYLCFKNLSKEIWITKENLIHKSQNKIIRNWSKLFFGTMLIFPLKYLTLLFQTDANLVMPFYNFQILISVFMILICILMLFNPEMLYGYVFLQQKMDDEKKSEIALDTIWKLSTKMIPNNQQDKNLKNKIDSHLIEYIGKIQKIVFEDNLLIKAGVTIDDMANKLIIPKSHLHYIFKYHTTLSFIELKKRTRIHYATQLIKEDFLKNNTLNSLSEKVGFSSYDPFYRSFKEITGNGPLEYYNFIRN